MSAAVISDCGKFRWRLERRLPEVPLHSSALFAGKAIAFFGVNPSTADASLDDATVRKWKGFCLRWGASKFIVGNVFGYRATDVYDLRTVQSLRHEENTAHILDIIADADILVPCWGSRDKLPKDLHVFLEVMKDQLRASGKPVKHLGLTASGDPKHPLMLGYATPLVDWEYP